ncbi:MAG: phosphate ABC transporter permease subunit PstC [Firmicutes bacterium ZCTH02-B6]|nr:MAG: phosphate ABC transporter permease subunit PstC [Firmicutes bacterium ZCTH02-B6]
MTHEKLETAKLGELAFRGATAAAASSILALAAVYAVQMTTNSWESIVRFGWDFVTGTAWDPVSDVYGALPFIWGTVVSSLVALVLAVPLSIGLAAYLSEVAPVRIRRIVEFFVELLAAIPSVVYGLWGIFVLVPFVREHVQPFLQNTLGFLPLFQGPPFGYGMLTAGILLAIMILPIITSLTREALHAVPIAQREASLALGSTRWETIRHAVLPYNKSGIIAAIVLGLGRALGETMAVTMVIGNVPLISPSLFMPGQTVASLLANEFAEVSGGLYLSALTELGLLLFGVTFILNVVTRLFVPLVSRKVGGAAEGRRQLT